MNRLLTDIPAGIRPEQLPAPKRSERTRLLFLTSNALGFKTLSRQFEAYTASRDDVEAVHVRVTLPGSLAWLGRRASIARGWDVSGFRSAWAWSRYIPSLLSHRLPPDRFDAAVLSTQLVARGMPRIKAQTGLPFATYVDTTVPQYIRDLGGGGFDWLSSPGERKILHSADVVAGMSRWALDSVRDDHGVPESRLLLVRNAVPVAPTLPERPARPAGPIRLAIVGNDWVRKGGDRLIRWHQARWKPAAEVHVFGANVPIDRTLEGVVWHGSVDHARLIGELLPSMDVFVLPTRADMSPWALIEAAGCGLPVVSSRLGAIHEIVEHGRSGFLCHPAGDEDYIQAVEKLMADAALRQSMGRAAHAHMLAAFTPQIAYGGLIDRLKSIIAAPATPRRDGSRTPA
ncbi:MAG TPA: glycosyltransferase family 4 protein [Phycisphaerales bacterium]|nr:glycosyltransferase family 4 protein [Phycisphaerales bacterium]